MSKKKLTGLVVSEKMDKTIVVRVDTTKTHKKYHKQYQIAKKYFVRDQKNKAQKGDIVEIIETVPFSKNGRWELVKIQESKKV
jgi:small subunit ribosomal protein S17